MDSVVRAKPTDAVLLDTDQAQARELAAAQSALNVFEESAQSTLMSTARSYQYSNDIYLDTRIEAYSKDLTAGFTRTARSFIDNVADEFRSNMIKFAYMITELTDTLKSELDNTKDKLSNVEPLIENIPQGIKQRAPGIKEPTGVDRLIQRATGVREPATSIARPSVGSIRRATGGDYKEDFVSKFGPLAERTSEKMGGKIPASWILSQWAIETGWGKSMPGENNYGGIKDLSGGSKPVMTTERYSPEELKRAQKMGEEYVGDMTKEEVDKLFGPGEYQKAISEGRPYRHIKSKFRQFQSPEEFSDHKAKLLESPRYKEALEARSPEEYSRKLHDAGYYTSSPETYSSAMKYISQYVEEKNKSPSDNMALQQTELKEGEEQPPIERISSEPIAQPLVMNYSPDTIVPEAGRGQEIVQQTDNAGLTSIERERSKQPIIIIDNSKNIAMSSPVQKESTGEHPNVGRIMDEYRRRLDRGYSV